MELFYYPAPCRKRGCAASVVAATNAQASLLSMRRHLRRCHDCDCRPRCSHPKMVELWVSSRYAFAEDGNLKCPHLPIINGDNWVDWWLVVGGYGVRGHLTHDVPR